jgi:hypothetical protein
MGAQQNKEEAMDGFMDFGIGVEDEGVGTKEKKYSAKDGCSDRISFAWFSIPGEPDADGNPTWTTDGLIREDGTFNPKAVPRFTGCQRHYIKGVGYVLHDGPAFNQFGKPKTAIATVVVVWPTNDEGDLDMNKFSKGKGWKVLPWIHGDSEKYKQIAKIHKRNPLSRHDVLFSCPENGAEYQKLTFLAEQERDELPSNLLASLMASEKPQAKATVRKILSQVKSIVDGLQAELATKMTVAEVIAKRDGKDPSTALDNSANTATDVDSMLDGVI